jgi:hypothetical protein
VIEPEELRRYVRSGALRRRREVRSHLREVQRRDRESVQRVRSLRPGDDECRRERSHVDERETRATDGHGQPRNASSA